MDVQSEKVLNLGRENNQSDAAREPDSEWIGDELQQRSQPGKTHNDEKKARHGSRHREPIITVLLNDAVNDDDECSRRTSDLHPAASEHRNNQSTDDRGVQTLLGLHTGSDSERDRERERYNADNESGNEVRSKLLSGVSIAEYRKKLGFKPFVQLLFPCEDRVGRACPRWKSGNECEPRVHIIE